MTPPPPPPPAEKFPREVSGAVSEDRSRAADDLQDEYDVIVVGLGPGGEFTANKLALAGLEVLAIDKHLVGGECPFYGCVPSKMMIRAAEALAEARLVREVAGDSSVTPDFGPVAERIRTEATHDWTDTVVVDRLCENGADVVHAHARLAGEGVVDVGGRQVRARSGIVLATGTHPTAPPIDGLADTPYWTNREVVKVTEAPSTLAVIGSGAIGSELAQVFQRFGSQVTLLEVADRILVAEEPEVSTVMTEVLTREGMRVMPGVDIASVSYADGHFSLDLGDETLRVEKLLVAAGRRTNLPDLGLETVGLDGEVDALDTDDCLHVLRDGEPVPGLFAVGDIVGKGPFTHTAKYQAGIVIRQLRGKPGPPADYRAVPRVTFTQPEVGAVGLTEEQAREQGLAVRIGCVGLPESSRGHMHGPGNDGLIKLVVVDDRLVGATSVGPAGGEVLSMLTLAVHARVPIGDLESMIYAYPTWHGQVRVALARVE
jgi:pyruvate/2-oxoglutarate dehydrogenase complex dihydrolipoamide dehydrogenase (E3) component